MNLILGGLITLAVTAVVQVLVIPWVQRRNRRLERWEDDIVDLEAVLNDELSRAIMALDLLVCDLQHKVRHARSGVVDVEPLGDYELYKERIMIAVFALNDVFTRLSRLLNRTRLVNRQAPLWHDMSNVAFHRTFGDLPDVLPSYGDLDQFANADLRPHFAAMYDECRTLRKMLAPVRLSMKPPRTYPLRRARRSVMALPGRLRNRRADAPTGEAEAANS